MSEIHKKVQDVLNRHNQNALRKRKVISHKTMADRAEICHMAFRHLKELGFHLLEPKNLGLRHVEALVNRWHKKEGLSASTLQKRLSVLRGFCEWMGKDGMIPPTLVLVPEAKRTFVAKNDKSWIGAGVDPMPLILKVQDLDPYVGMQLKLMWAFGMRSKEAVCFRPRQNDKGEFIEVGQGAVVYLNQGTKGGRERIVELDFMPDAAKRRAVLDEAKSLVDSADAHMGRPGSTLLQNLRRFFYICNKAGITASQLGITSHGLRHGMLSDGFEALTGHQPQVRGGVGEGLSKEAETEARLRMTRNAGHGRTQITSAYYGSPVSR